MGYEGPLLRGCVARVDSKGNMTAQSSLIGSKLANLQDRTTIAFVEPPLNAVYHDLMLSILLKAACCANRIGGVLFRARRYLVTAISEYLPPKILWLHKGD
jgi:hypothetical protein